MEVNATMRPNEVGYGVKVGSIQTGFLYRLILNNGG